MSTMEFYINFKLSDFDWMTENLLIYLEGYNIHTLGQLLGATKGLSNTEVFEPFNKEYILQSLRDFISEEVIEEFKSFSFDRPTGLLKKEDYEDKEE